MRLRTRRYIVQTNIKYWYFIVCKLNDFIRCPNAYLCRRYTYVNDDWLMENVTLDQPRRFSAAIKIHNGTMWWITGGHSNNYIPLKTTETLSISNNATIQSFSPGPDLPVAMSGHCIARVDDSRVFIAGGQTNAYIYDEINKNFTKLPNLNSKRERPACSAVNIVHDGNNTTTLMVVGGSNFNKPKTVYSFEIYVNGSWMEWAGLLAEGSSSNAGYITYEDERGLVLVAGKVDGNPNLDLSDKLVRFNEKAEFHKLPAVLEHRRVDPSVINIPKGGIQC